MVGPAEILVAYVGPEVIMPLASVFAGVLGVLLMFGRYLLRLPKKLFVGCFPRSKAASAGRDAAAPRCNLPESAACTPPATEQAGLTADTFSQ
jgi:hypothetical protein